jgi:protein disulfide-isomerase
MKHFLLILAVALSVEAFSITSQAGDGAWLTDFEKAKKIAKKESKLVLLDFTGSDWCPPCKALHRNVVSKSDFLAYAKDNLVLVEVDFPRRKPQSPELRQANKELARKFKIEGYPTVIVTDSEGKSLSNEVGYLADTAESYIAKIEKLRKK